MKYMGSKRRISKEILPIILRDRVAGQYYVEPFVGGANSLCRVENPRIGSDINKYVIRYFQALTSDNWAPPKNVSEQDYQTIKQNLELYDPSLVGYVAFNMSYGGKWFGGYRRDKIGRRNYSLESYREAIKQKDKLLGVEWYNFSYDLLGLPPNSIIYCDPPYAGTTEYKDDFDHNMFWEWCREVREYGHSVFISEYNAPEDFKCIWQKELSSSLTNNTGAKKGIEKLFVPT